MKAIGTLFFAAQSQFYVRVLRTKCRPTHWLACAVQTFKKSSMQFSSEEELLPDK